MGSPWCWLRLRRRWERVRARVDSLEETEAFCSTQLVSESSQSWMILDGVSVVYFFFTAEMSYALEVS